MKGEQRVINASTGRFVYSIPDVDGECHIGVDIVTFRDRRKEYQVQCLAYGAGMHLQFADGSLIRGKRVRRLVPNRNLPCLNLENKVLDDVSLRS